MKYLTCAARSVCSNLGPVMAIARGACERDHVPMRFGACGTGAVGVESIDSTAAVEAEPVDDADVVEGTEDADDVEDEASDAEESVLDGDFDLCSEGVDDVVEDVLGADVVSGSKTAEYDRELGRGRAERAEQLDWVDLACSSAVERRNGTRNMTSDSID